MTFTHALSTNNYGPAKFIVDASAANGTHTTIAAALTSASSGDTIFIRPGTFTEDISLKAGVNLTAYDGDGLNGNVIILGKATATGAGTFNISNVQLKTNSDFCLVVSGSSATIVNLEGVYINGNNNTSISYTTSSASSKLNCYFCVFDLQTTGIAYYSMSSTGILSFYSCVLNNVGISTTAASNSAGNAYFENSTLTGVLSTSSSGLLSMRNCDHNTSTINTTCITTAGTGALHGFSNNFFASGTASAFSIGAGTTVGIDVCSINSSNTNAITGAGTLNYKTISLSGTGLVINTTTQTGGIIVGGRTQSPTASFLGESILSTGSVTTASATPSNITSINLTAGIWDVSAIYWASASVSVTAMNIGISTNSASFTGVSFGDNGAQAVTAGAIQTISVPTWRVTITSTTTYYLVQQTSYTVTCTMNGRISATRVA